ncbi:hypothetical protein MAMP_00615 [Methylophaga aminisulfidivorans MP]|jgi:hypothetical protein|uniref:Uncharacterized protein n=1 Tax=Methylophaga aminisulfidivorans MP TaxID=1026882 RepID=F5T388_9GAMM|nr:hypothetical protein MAMP_00615 [Methylophaga aminisulfidivorans MP]
MSEQGLKLTPLKIRAYLLYKKQLNSQASGHPAHSSLLSIFYDVCLWHTSHYFENSSHCHNPSLS